MFVCRPLSFSIAIAMCCGSSNLLLAAGALALSFNNVITLFFLSSFSLYSIYEENMPAQPILVRVSCPVFDSRKRDARALVTVNAKRIWVKEKIGIVSLCPSSSYTMPHWIIHLIFAEPHHLLPHVSAWNRVASNWIPICLQSSQSPSIIILIQHLHQRFCPNMV